MSCGCNCNPCQCEDECDPSNEPLSSALDNFTSSFYGTITKTCVDDKIVWNLPCNLDEGIAGFPRIAGEGLACYILRVLEAPPTPPTIAILDEGVELTASVAQINFVGDGVTATVVGNDVTVTIPASGSSDCCFVAQTVWVDNNAVDLSSRGMPAYLTFQEGYDAANAMQVALGGANVVNLQIGVMTAAESGNLILLAAYNSNVTITGVNQKASKLGSITGNFAIDLKCKNVSINGITSAYLGADNATNGAAITVNATADSYLGPIDSSALTGGSGGAIFLHSNLTAGSDFGASTVTSKGRINGGLQTIVGFLTSDIDVSATTGNGGNMDVESATLGAVVAGAQNPGRLRFDYTKCQRIDWLKGSATSGLNSKFNNCIFASNVNQDCIGDIFADGALFTFCLFDPDGVGISINSSTAKTVYVYNGLSRVAVGVNVTVVGTLTVAPQISAPY